MLKVYKSKKEKGPQLLETLYCTCDPDWIQTNDLLLRRQLLYSTELPDHFLFINSLPTLDFKYVSLILALPAGRYSTELPDLFLKQAANIPLEALPEKNIT